MFHSDAFDEGLLDELAELRGKLGPVTCDFFAEEHRGELANVWGFCGAKVVNQSRNHLRILSQTLDLLLRLSPGIIVRHQELNQ